MVYTIEWDDAAVALKIYEKFKNRIKNTMVGINRFRSLKNIINIAVKIDDRQHDMFVNKKTWFKFIPKNKPQFKKTPMELDVTGKKKYK